MGRVATLRPQEMLGESGTSAPVRVPGGADTVRSRGRGIDNEAVVPMTGRFVEVGGEHAYPGGKRAHCPAQIDGHRISRTGDFGILTPLLQIGLT